MMRARIFAKIAWFLVSIWSRTIKICFVNREVPERLAAKGENFIYAFFHGNLFLMLYTHRDSGVMIPASESRDGEIMARLLMHFGFTVVRGSSKRKGQKALLALISGIRRGKTVAIAVDGPRGPLGEVKEGVLFLAGLSKVPIIPVVAVAKSFMVIKKSWDKFMVPAPFTEGFIIYGNPIYVNNTSYEEIQSARSKLETDLKTLIQQTPGYGS